MPKLKSLHATIKKILRAAMKIEDPAYRNKKQNIKRPGEIVASFPYKRIIPQLWEWWLQCLIWDGNSRPSSVEWHKNRLEKDYHSLRASKVALVVKTRPANAGDIRDKGLIPGLERSPGEGHGNPLQYSCLENPMDRRAWWASVCRVANSWPWLSD